MKNTVITVKVNKKTKKRLDQIANEEHLTKSAIIRDAIDLYSREFKLNGGTSLVRMAEKAKQYKNKAPKDIVENFNKYLYEKI